MFSSYEFYVVAGAALLLYAIYRVSYTRRLLKNSEELVAQSKPFERIVPNAAQTILILGDSTAVGTGATPETSIAGRLGTLYPAANVYNYGINGQKLAGLLAQMETIKITNAELVLLQIGANDITYFTPLPQVDAQLQKVLAKARMMSEKVVVFHSELVGDAPFFPPWLGWIWNIRTRAVRTIYIKDTQAAGAMYIDAIKSSIGPAFASDIKKYYAPDMFHPSGEGYKLWFEEIKKALI